jgi:putative hydrolase of the HAD superfamily
VALPVQRDAAPGVSVDVDAPPFDSMSIRARLRPAPTSLSALRARRFLVTSGFRRLQESKIEALGIAPLFEAIFVDAIDEPGPKGKERIFREILERHALRTDEVLVVGDNPASEIEAGNRLRLTTVQILRPGVTRGGNAKHVISGLAELEPLLRS